MFLGGAMLFSMAVARPATAQTFLENMYSYKVLDVPAFSNLPGTLIEQWSLNGGTNQQWQVVPYNGNHYVIMNTNSNQVLDVPDFSTSEGTLIEQWPFNGGDNQLWDLYPVYPGTNRQIFYIVNVYSGLVLDLPGGSTDQGEYIEQWPFNGGANQQWRLEHPAIQLGPF
jgi:hypothetical protein